MEEGIECGVSLFELSTGVWHAHIRLVGGGVFLSAGRGVFGCGLPFFFPLLVIWGGDLGAEQRSEFSDLLYSYFIPVLDIQKYKERIFEAFTIKTSCACAFVLFLLLFFSF